VLWCIVRWSSSGKRGEGGDTFDLDQGVEQRQRRVAGVMWIGGWRWGDEYMYR
jgi:hypothetical protein